MQTSLHTQRSNERTFPFILAGLILFLTGSFISIDWMNYLSGTDSIYPAYIKPVISLLCLVIACGALRFGLDRKDARLLAVIYACILIVDVTMSIYVYAPPSTLTSTAFLIGAALSIVAHLLLIVRHARGFAFLRSAKKSWLYRFGFPLAFYLPVIVILLLLTPQLNRVNQFWPSIVYALILTTSLWIAWETVRQKLFPRPNAWLIALGVTSWFITELVGVVHNIEIGALSDIAMNLTWLFYMPAILLLAFSGYRWSDSHSKPRTSH
ncbi:MAG TPA: hypothetical protein VHO48_02605 [Anaerolineaceae bacterium]|nr:hypothetical protein [Anaerolineaceae bacterium]